MLRVGLVLRDVAAFLPLMIHRVLLQVSLVDIFRRHAERLRERHQEVKKVHDFDLGVLLVELLVFGPPLPRHAVDQLGRLLLHGASIVKNPFRLFLVSGRRQIYSNTLIERILHTKNLLEFVHAQECGSPSGRWQARRPGKFKLPCSGGYTTVTRYCRCLPRAKSRG